MSRAEQPDRPSDTPELLVLMGTRPEAIKLAPVIRAIRDAPGLACHVVSTGQHREMLDQVDRVFQLGIDTELSVMRPSQGLSGLAARVLEGLDPVLEQRRPAGVVVQGDTTSALMGALAAFHRRVPVAHVEAGLRTGRMDAPFPEEANRVLVSRITRWHFPPTSGALHNLLAEGVPEAACLVTGNTVIDALRIEHAAQLGGGVAGTEADTAVDAAFQEADRPGTPWRDRSMVLITGHRRENFGGGFDRICDALRGLAERHPETLFVYPVHLNPEVLGPVRQRLGGLDNVALIAPQPYRPFVALMRRARVILTDSGGVQEEAPSLGVPVLVMRETTERPEGVDAGTIRLVGTDVAAITKGVSELLTDDAAHAAVARATNPYGDGHAAGRIVERLVRDLTRRA